MGSRSGPEKAGRSRDLREHYLEDWSVRRGPLFEDPRAAVCRAFALVMAVRIAAGGPERAQRMRAARVLDEALSPVPDSNAPASKEQRAKADMALVDIRRAARAAGGRSVVGEIRAALDKAAPDQSVDAQLKSLALAEQLDALLCGEDSAIQLRAARTLLARTREAARRVGRERPQSEQSRPAQPDLPEDEKRRSETDSSAPDTSDRHVPPPPGGGAAAPQAYECKGPGSERGPP